MSQAFWREVISAQAIHGDAGDTGTIAEKYEFVEVEAPHSVRSIDLARWVLDFRAADRDEVLAGMPEAVQATVAAFAEIALDKSGPALAIKLSPIERLGHVPLGNDALYLFFGLARC